MKMNRKILLMFAMAMISVLTILSLSQAASTVTSSGFTTCTVHASNLNIRSGPGTTYPVVGSVAKGARLNALGKINGWYLIQTGNDVFGMVSGWYITPNTSSGSNNTTNNNTSTSTLLTADEQEVLRLVNQARANAGLSKLTADDNITKVARIKAQDMVNNNYFSHNSPTYGTPFEMMKSFGISYKSAGENIAAHSTVEAAFNAWMNSSGHRANILNSSFNYTGIGVVSSPKYGKMLVQMFVGQ